MVLWSRLRQSKHKLHLFTSEFKRCYNTLHRGPIVSNQHISSRSLFRFVNNSDFAIHGTQFEIFQKVRFFAAPVQAVQKKNERDTSGHRLNEQITTPTIRLVCDEEHYVISRHEALARAKSLNLDLVEVDSHSKPPVCKIFDYHKEKYIRQVKEKERAKSRSKLKSGAFKEVRFAAKINKNDLQMKADMVKRLMDSGHRVKCTAIEPTDNMDLPTLLSRFSDLIEDVAIEESGPQFEKKQVYIIVRHAKFGPAKSKGPKKKSPNTSVSSESDKNQPSEEKEEAIETGSESEQEWAVFDGDDDDINAVFNDSENGRPKSSKHEKSSDVTGPPPPYPVDHRTTRQHVEVRNNTLSSSTPLGVPNHPTVNRYSRDPRAGKPPRIPTDINPRFDPNIEKQPTQFSNNTSPLGKQPSQFSNRTSPLGKQPSQFSNNSGPQMTKSFGIFNPQKGNNNNNTTPNEQNSQAAINRYKKSDPSSETARGPRTGFLPPGRNPPTQDPRMNRGRWGAFGADNSNVIPNKNESQAEIQRR